MNKKAVIGIMAVGVVTVAVATHTGLAQSLNTYLEDKSNTILRIELIAPPEALQANDTFWGKIRLFLGIRQIARIKPAVGTKLLVQASAYASSPYQTDATPCITAAGTRVRPGVVATNFLPLGTLLDISGQEFIVEDRMNPRYAGYYLDVWFPSTSSALQFGRKQIAITIKGYGDPGQDIRTAESEPEDKKAAATKKKVSVWEHLQTQLASISELLGARRRGNVDQYDINCLADAENG